VRRAAGHIEPPTETFTSGFVRETAQGYTVVSDEAVIRTALELFSRRISRGPLLASPRATRDYLRLRFAGLQHEVFCLLYLDKRHRLIAFEELFRGTIDGASVHPREVVKAALRHNCAAIICAHNHPLCFVGGVNRGIRGRFGLALTRLKVSRRHARQGAALLATGSLLCSPEVASRACDEACCGVRGVLVGNPAHSIE
jgi:hypothetical protein